MYNVKVKRFGDSLQVQVFSKAVNSSGDDALRRMNPLTGEIVDRTPRKPRPRGTLQDCPFSPTGKEYLVDMEEVRKLSSQRSVRRSKNAIYDIARSNTWEWFFTFTFAEESVRRNYDRAVESLSKWLKQTKSFFPDMKYVLVPEQFKKGGYHFHGLFSNVDGIPLVFSGLYDGSGRPIFNLPSYGLGFTTVTRVSDSKKAVSYLTKYVTKELCQVSYGKKRYWCSRNCLRPEVTEFFMEQKEERRLHIFMKSFKFVKTVKNTHNTVTYIEL